jgi:flagellar biosynthesis/type III secretory pathway chaperone
MNTLEASLKTLNRELETFLALLEEESIALASSNSERLDQLTHQRHGASQNLAESWRQLAEQLGLSAESSLPALRLRAFADKSPSLAWLKLEKLTHEAARLNRVNGRLIEEQMRRTDAAMQVLQSASTRSLYGADGRLSDAMNNNRSIDSA